MIATGVGDEVAAVADDDRVAVEHLPSSRYMRTGCSGERESLSSSCSAARFSDSTARSSASQRPLRGSPPPAASRIAARLARDVADQVDLGRPVGDQRVRGDVEPDDLRLLAEAAAEAEPEVHRHADHQGHVGPLQRGAARAAEGQLVVGRDSSRDRDR